MTAPAPLPGDPPPPIIPAPSPSPPGDPLNPDGLQKFSDEQRKLAQDRVKGGQVVGCAGFLLVILTGVCAFWRFAHEDLSLLKPSRDVAWMFGIKVAAEAVVSIALVYFGYQLLKVAERMLLPHWWASKDNLDVARTMLGINSPVDGAEKTVRSLADAARDIRELLTKKDAEKKDE